MSFLDNLENSLKSLESREEKDGSERDRRSAEQATSRASAPWAEKLRKSDFTQRLMEHAAVAGHRLRAKIYMAWMDSTLRLEVKGRALELRPTPTGIVAVSIEPDGETKSEPVDLAGNPEELLQRWIG
ncbi:MAG TPA: hypothetical protein VH325_17465 [Bryobacteraceae bacterium]|jgi:hypothetical protein|nr:hypothetical protein [Bryobacteraceae bacterium]